MKKEMMLVVSIVLTLFFMSFASAEAISEDLHLNIQTTYLYPNGTTNGTVVTGTYAFVFDISRNSNCFVDSAVIYTNSVTLATDSRGIISYYLPNVALNFSEQYYLCYYRGGILVNNASIKIVRTPYSFSAGSLESISNFDIGNYTMSASYYYGSGAFLTDVNGTLTQFDCANGQVLRWSNSSGIWYCSDISIPSSGEYIDAIVTDGIYLTGGQTNGTVNLVFNETKLDERADLRIAANNQSVINWALSTFTSLSNIVSQVGNWSADKSNYYTKTETDMNLSFANASFTNYADSIGSKWNSNYTNMKTACSPNFVTGIYENGTFICGSIEQAAESDPYWTANQTAYNESWSTTYNQTTVDSTNMYILTNNNSVNNYISSNNQSVINWAISTFTSLTGIMEMVGNWSADKPNYYTRADVDMNISLVNTSTRNYVDEQNTSQTNFIVSNNQSVTNAINTVAAAGEPLWSANQTAYNESWSYTHNQTTNDSVTNFIVSNNQSVNSYINSNNQSVTNAINTVATAGEPLWSANKTAYNESWSNTYNQTTVDSINSYINSNNQSVNNYILTNNQSIINWATSIFTSLVDVVGGVGNWSEDKPNYYTKTDVDMNLSILNTSTINYIGEVNTSMKNYVDSEDNSQDNLITLNNASINSYINSNNQSVTNAINAVAAAGEPLWSANKTAYNESWSYTYNQTTNDSITNSIAVNNQSVTNSIVSNNASINNYISSNNASIINWVISTFTSFEGVVGIVGNWSADKPNYYTKTEVNDVNTSMRNYVGEVNTSMKNYVDSEDDSQTNLITLNNNSINNYIYSNNGSVVNYISSVNTSMKNYVNSTFITKANEPTLNVNSANYLDGYDSSFFMPLNKTVYGQYDFNGGWTSNGTSIIGGGIYAQTGNFYNINSLSVSSLNINGSLFPPEGYDAQFDIGNASLRWRNMHLSGQMNSGTASITGTLYVGGVNISERIAGNNASMKNYVDSQNTSQTNYINAQNTSQTNANNAYVRRSTWTDIDNYPAACGAGTYATTIGDTLTCATPAGTGITSVTGTAPVVSSGGTTPVISMAAASSGVNGYMTGTYATKLDSIETGATADQTAAEILTAVKTVDGAGSGLDADLLDGLSSASFDQSNSNEIQTLGTSGNTITLTSGGAVTAPYATNAGNANACSADGTCEMQGISGTDQIIENNYGAYLHLGSWAVARTAANAVLVNTAYMADMLANDPAGCSGNSLVQDINAVGTASCVNVNTLAAATAGSVPWSGVTSVPSTVYTSAARPGPYKLYRSDDNSGYGLQTNWNTPWGGYWGLRGYDPSGNFHAEVAVGYAAAAGSAGSASSVPWSGVTGKPTTLAGYGIADWNYGNYGNLDSVSGVSGSYYFNAGSPIPGQSDGTLWYHAYPAAPTTWGSQLVQDYRNGRIYTRGRNNGAWSAWWTNIDSGNIGSQSVSYATTAGSAPANGGNSDTVDGLHASSFSRKDTTSQWIKPYYEYGSYLTTEAPATLASQMGGGGLRVDFLHPSYTSNGKWGQTITWSGYNYYGMYQLAGGYGDATSSLAFRHEINAGSNTWSGWKTIIDSSTIGSQSVSYATTAGSAPANGGNSDTVDGYHMNQNVLTSSSPTFNYVYGSGSIRFGDMWGGAGLYQPSGNMVFGTSGGQWVFSNGAVTKAIIGTDGNLWMAWAGDWLSTILAAKATHRGEGTNYIDYSRYVYNNGAYSGSGWIEPSDLGVRYASTAGTATTATNANNLLSTINGLRLQQYVRGDPYGADGANPAYDTGAMGRSTQGPNEVFTNGRSGFVDVWGGTGYPSGLSHMQGFQAMHYSGGYGIQILGQYSQDAVYVRQATAGTLRGWRLLIDSGNIGSQSVSYANTAGTAAEATNNYFYVRGTSPSVHFVDTDNGVTRWVHQNGDSIGFLGSTSNWILRVNDASTVFATTFSGALSGNAATATYAATAGSAPANGGTSTYATYLWSVSHPGSYYISNTWDGTYWQLTSNHGSPVNVGHATNAGYATTAGSAPAAGGNSDSVDGQHFAWSNRNNNPTYLWAADSNGDTYLAWRAGMSVSYATTAGSAPANGGTSTQASYLNTAGLYYQGGLVGIGTSGPSNLDGYTKLDVHGSVNIGADTSDNLLFFGHRNQVIGRGDMIAWSSINDFGMRNDFGNIALSSGTYPTRAQFVVYPNSGTRSSVEVQSPNSDGGIWLVSENYAGTSAILGSINGGGVQRASKISFKDHGGYPEITFGVSDYYNSLADNPDDITGFVDVLTIDHTGKVGIGTTVANSKLSINTAGDVNIGLYVTGGSATIGMASYGSYTGINGQGGTVGIEGASPGSYDFYASGAATNYGASSSIRWKDNITEINPQIALDKILQIKGSYFDWNGYNNNTKHDMGFIAEDIGEIVPEVVGYETNLSNSSNWYVDENGVKKLYATGVDYGALTPMIVQAMKGQQNLIVSQNDTINTILENINKHNDEINNQNASINAQQNLINNMNITISQQNDMINNQNETINSQQNLLNNICSNNPELCQ